MYYHTFITTTKNSKAKLGMEGGHALGTCTSANPLWCLAVFDQTASLTLAWPLCFYLGLQLLLGSPCRQPPDRASC